MVTSGRIPQGYRVVTHQIIHLEAAGHHCDAHLQPAHKGTMHGSGKDAVIQHICEMVGSKRGTEGRVTCIIL